MRALVIAAVLMLASSCTKQVMNDPPLGYSFMPGYLNIDSIQPIVIDDTNKIVDTTMHDFVSVAVDSGQRITKDGILISDRKAVLYVFYKSSWERQQKELYYTKYLMREYYDKAKAAETLYQSEIVRWKKASERTWLERNSAYIGFGCGLATTILTCFALFYGAK